MSATNDDYQKRKSKIIKYLGGKCRFCGSVDNLQFDHVDSLTKSFNVSSRWSYSWKNLLPEIKKCQLLCDPCHKKKTRDIDGHKSEHGKYSMYRHGNCRCNLCKEANRLQVAEWRKRRNNTPS